MGTSRAIDVQEVIDSAALSTTQRRALIMCFALAVVDGFDSLMLGFVVPAIAADWAMTAAGLTPLIMGGLIGTIVGGLVFAPLGDRWGRRPVILGGVALFGVFTLAGAFAPNLALLVVLRFAAGLGLGAVAPNLLGYGAEYAPLRSRATVVTVVGASLAAGGFVGGFVSAWLIQASGWRAVFVVGGLLPLVLVVVGWRGLPETVQFQLVRGRTAAAARMMQRIAPEKGIAESDTLVLPERGAADKAPLAALFADGRALRTILLWIVYFNGLLLSFFVFSWMPSLLTAAGLTGQAPQITTAIYTLGGMIGGILFGMAADRMRSPARLLTGGFLLAVVATFVTAETVGSLVPVLFAAFALGIGVTGTQTCVNAVAAMMYPSQIRSTGVGWAYGVGRVGSLVGPSIGGLLLAAEFAPKQIFLLAAVPAVLAAVAMFLLSLRRIGADREAEVAPVVEAAG